MAKFTQKTIGIKEFLRQLQDVQSQLGTKKPRVDVSFEASGGRNVLEQRRIALGQAKEGRRFWFLSIREQQKIRDKVSPILRDFSAGRARIETVAPAVERIMKDAFKEHLSGRRASRGSFPAVGAEYASRKRRRGQGSDPLRATGDLMDGFRVKAST